MFLYYSNRPSVSGAADFGPRPPDSIALKADTTMNIGNTTAPATAIHPDITHVFQRQLQHHLQLAVSSLGYGQPARGRKGKP